MDSKRIIALIRRFLKLDFAEPENCENPKFANGEDWRVIITPLIKDVNVTCRKKRFTERRKNQIITISFAGFMIGAVAVAVNVLANNLMGVFVTEIIPAIAPSNQTQIIIENQTVTQAQLNQVNFMMQQLPALLALTVGVIAVIVTVYAIVVPLIFGTSTVSDISEEYYIKLRKGLPKNLRPFLKALIN